MDIAERLLAIDEIRQLKSRYFRFLDTKDWAGMATIFTDDAVFDARAAFSVDGAAAEGPAVASNDWLYTGGATILAFLQEAAKEFITSHHGHCHEVEILSATEAQGVIAMEDQLYRPVDGRPVLWMHGTGHYHERYRKADGAWRIAHSRITRLYVLLS
ncbi:MAG TPA: nuclear transport factor 2 family protein [Stellaceae bacterium]|nr:nuclear transport factor 2 family protein [Stellaceae bacterium]